MEQKEKIEKPEWVEIVETLPEIIRQQVGTTCAGLISSLVQIYFIKPELYDAVRNASDGMLHDYWLEIENRNNENV